MRHSSLFVTAVLACSVSAFVPSCLQGRCLVMHKASTARSSLALDCGSRRAMRLWAENEEAAGQAEAEEEVIPGKMKVSEIKAELDLRGVSYKGVFERSELETLLTSARNEGKARPEILEEFNTQRENTPQTSGDGVNKNVDWDALRAGDGSAPGGVDVDALKSLSSNSELLSLMANPKLQEFMRAVMEKDDAKMAEFAADAEIIEMMARFQQLAKDSGVDLSAMRRQ